LKEYGKFAVLDRPKDSFRIKEHLLPEPDPGTMLLKVEMCGVCGTDVHYWKGHEPILKFPFPVLFGHEVVGKVVAIGEGVETDMLGNPVKIGDRIVPVPLVTCGKCYYCTIIREPIKCLNAQAYGHLGEDKPFTGGYSQYLYLSIPNTVFFKTDLPPEVAVFTEPLSIAVNAVERVKVNLGDEVVIQGSGPIGLMALICAIEAGASKTIVVGGPERRLKLAEEFGADETINIYEIKDPQERVRMVKEKTLGGFGAAVAFECAGVPEAVPEGIDYLRFFGRYCEAGNFSIAGKVQINPCTHICAKCAKIVGAWSSLPDHFVKSLKILEKGKYHVERLISHRLPLERLDDAFKALSTDYKIDGVEAVKVVIAP
jgi:L-iditol 2-dehydrogenase